MLCDGTTAARDGLRFHEPRIRQGKRRDRATSRAFGVVASELRHRQGAGADRDGARSVRPKNWKCRKGGYLSHAGIASPRGVRYVFGPIDGAHFGSAANGGTYGVGTHSGLHHGDGGSGAAAAE